MVAAVQAFLEREEVFYRVDLSYLVQRDQFNDNGIPGLRERNDLDRRIIPVRLDCIAQFVGCRLLGVEPEDIVPVPVLLQLDELIHDKGIVVLRRQKAHRLIGSGRLFREDCYVELRQFLCRHAQRHIARGHREREEFAVEAVPVLCQRDGRIV